MKRDLYILNSYANDRKIAHKQQILNNETLQELKDIINALLNYQKLDPKYKDHPLQGDYKGYRDCHIRPDLVLIYKITQDALELVRLGRHLDIFKNKK